MKIEFTGRQTEISMEIQRLAERKLLKVKKALPRMTRAHVILTADKHRQIAEVSVHSRNLDLAADEVSTNPRRSVSNATTFVDHNLKGLSGLVSYRVCEAESGECSNVDKMRFVDG